MTGRGRVDVLGVGVDPVDRQGMLDAVGALAAAKGRATVAYANVHVVNSAQTDPALRDFLREADLCYCDGVGVRLGARILGSRLPERMTGADWIWDFAQRAEGRWRVFWLGGKPGVAEAAAARLVARHPRLEVATEHGFHDDAASVIARINAFRPDIVLVGMGTPAQERFVAAHRAAIDAPVVWVLGATADFLSGRVSRGPAWLHQRQEWLARLLVDPRRLWRRYLVGNAVFLARVAARRAGPHIRSTSPL